MFSFLCAEMLFFVEANNCVYVKVIIQYKLRKDICNIICTLVLIQASNGCVATHFKKTDTAFNILFINETKIYYLQACKDAHWAERCTFSEIYLVFHRLEWSLAMENRTHELVYLDMSQLKLEDIRTCGFSKYSREELGSRFHLQIERHCWGQTKITE